MFRDYGEQYIQTYKPSIQQIKLIRAIRICKTAALGGHSFICKDCGHKHYSYNSCGHSHCMLCQSIKREQWLDKLRNTLLAVPYVHCVFTLPHQLNGLARLNKSKIYAVILKSAWLTIQSISKQSDSTPGMTSVLHTFGSDLKYHIHVHSLVTFGGLSNDGLWIYPIHKNRLDKYRRICKLFRDFCVRQLKQLHHKNKISYHQNFDELMSEVENIRWVVHSTWPTMQTNTIQTYLAKYINRIAVTNSRLQYIKGSSSVSLMYNDYQNQVTGKAAPKAYKCMDPLTAIHQILQHVLPPSFQKTRKYGLHHPSSSIKHSIPAALVRNGLTVRTSIQIITQLAKEKPFICQNCGSDNLLIQILQPDKSYIFQFISSNSLKAPPYKRIHIVNTTSNCSVHQQSVCP